MNPMRRIRRQVFSVTQARMGALIGVSQATISRWEAGELEPSHSHLEAIRAHAIKQDLAWDDVWFFEVAADEVIMKAEHSFSETAPS